MLAVLLAAAICAIAARNPAGALADIPAKCAPMLPTLDATAPRKAASSLCAGAESPMIRNSKSALEFIPIHLPRKPPI